MIDYDIPGFTDKNDLLILEEFASKVPENGIVVEIGSCVGRSAYVLASTVASSVQVYCYNTWWVDDQPNLDAYVGDQTWQESYGSVDTSIESRNLLSIFETNMKQRGITNVIPMHQESPPEDFPFGEVDLIFIDGDHEFDGVYADVDFWYPRLSQNGVICGHDYCQHFPGVKKAVHLMAEKYNREVEIMNKTTIWRFAGN